MSRIKDEKAIVAPGDTVYDGEEIYANSGVYTENDKIISKYVGVVEYSDNSVRVVPMSGRYIPEEGDIIIGEVENIGYSHWMVDVNSPYIGRMKIEVAVDEYIDLDDDDLSDYFDVGEAIVAEVSSVSETMDFNLSMEDKRCKKLSGGRIIEVYPSKVPRVIGKKGTMIKQIKKKTGCKIIVGQNGQVWINGDNPNLAMRAIKKVESEAHTSGLTDKIDEWLDKELEKMED